MSGHTPWRVIRERHLAAMTPAQRERYEAALAEARAELEADLDAWDQARAKVLAAWNQSLAEHTCDPAVADCAAYLHYADPANREPAEGTFPVRRRRRDDDDGFYEEDEPLEKIQRIVARGPDGVTGPPEP
jgi:hypothetical protein